MQGVKGTGVALQIAGPEPWSDEKRSSMHIALVAPLFESVPPRLYGGTERVVSNLCRGLTDLGCDVTLFASGDSLVPGALHPVVPEALRLTRVPINDPIPYNFKLLSEVAA